jgi:hypothetical protein
MLDFLEIGDGVVMAQGIEFDLPKEFEGDDDFLKTRVIDYDMPDY